MVQARWILMLVAVVVLGGSDFSCGATNETKVATVEHGLVKNDVPGTGGDDVRIAWNLGNDQWRAVPHYPAINSAWTPDVISASPIDNQPAVQKRRRLRKRKRRPQPPVFSITEGESEDIEDRLAKRRQQQLQPHQLGDMHEPWKEMEEEGVQRPSTRRRISPVYSMVDLPRGRIAGAISATMQWTATSDKNNQSIEASVSTTNMPDLKLLLKLNGGTSLSEILQQRNLSLADLLRGQQEAILALTDRPFSSHVISEYKPPSRTDEGKLAAVNQNPPIVRKEMQRHLDSITEKPPENMLNKNAIDVQRNRLSMLYNKENKLYSEVTKYDVITEGTTERRIFVPSHPKYYTSIDYRPELEDVSDKIFIPGRRKIPADLQPETTTTPVITTTPMEITTIKQSLLSNMIRHLALQTTLKSRLPITSAKLMKKTTSPMFITTSERNDSGETIVPVQAIKIDLKDLFGFNTLVKPDVKPSSNKGPLKMIIDLDNIIKTTQKTDVDNFQTNVIPDDSSTWITELETVTAAEKLKTVSAKDEIMEVLQDEITKAKLTKLLESRNMTIDELVEQRERGSSQRHLADIFHNKTQEPEPVETVHEGYIEAPIHRATDRQPKNTVLQEVTSTTTTSIKITSSSSDITNEIKLNPDYSVTSFPSYKIESDKSGSVPSHVPVWKSIYSTIRSDLLLENLSIGSVEETIDQSNDLFVREMQQIDEIENTIAQAVNDEEEQMLQNQYSRDDEHFHIPYGVKSAIFASLAIIGISLIVFLTILVIFRWTQRHKKRLCYSGSFSCSKIKSPIVEVPVDPQHRSLRTIMNETLGRKSNMYKTRLQSMSDSWDSDGGCGSGKSYK